MSQASSSTGGLKKEGQKSRDSGPEFGFDNSSRDEPDLSSGTHPEDTAVPSEMGIQPRISNAVSKTGTTTEDLSKSDASQAPAPEGPAIKTLPKDTEIVRFVGEGAANAVFEIEVPGADDRAAEFKGLLLRVAKVASPGVSPTYNYLQQQKHYESVIQPILGHDAVHQELVVLRDSGIIAKSNAFLQRVGHKRKEKFKDSLVGQSDWGFLVEDMQPQNATDTLLIEFKPKWLLQSPSAPKDAVRCRQCALNLQTFVRNPENSQTYSPMSTLCPLALVQDTPWPANSPFRIAPQLAQQSESKNYYEEILRRTIGQEIFQTLRRQQGLLDQRGPLDASADDAKFTLAMTLRDCTCFALLPRYSTSVARREPVKIRLGDLDWKDPSQKIERWRSAESALIQGGFYTSTAIVCEGVEWQPPTLCALENQVGRAEPVPAHLRVFDSAHSASLHTVGTSGRSYAHVSNTNILRANLERLKAMA